MRSGIGCWTGNGSAFETVDPVVLAGELDRAAGEQAGDDLDGLLEARDTNPGRIERDAGLDVFGLDPARADAELETPLGEQVKHGRLLGEHGRVAKVVVQDERTEPQRAE